MIFKQWVKDELNVMVRDFKWNKGNTMFLENKSSNDEAVDKWKWCKNDWENSPTYTNAISLVEDRLYFCPFLSHSYELAPDYLKDESISTTCTD